jgi:hypothetical protein
LVALFEHPAFEYLIAGFEGTLRVKRRTIENFNPHTPDGSAEILRAQGLIKFLSSFVEDFEGDRASLVNRLCETRLYR